MTRKRPEFTPTPRIWGVFDVATRLGHSESWFSGKRSELESKGFPPYDDFLGGWDADAIDLWLDQRSGLNVEYASSDPALDKRLEGMVG